MAKVNIKTFKKALENSGGNQSIIAQRLKVGRSTITIFLNKNPKMRALCEIEAERIIDVAENVLDHDITTNKNVDSAKWKLNNSKRGKARGYGLKQEIELAAAIATSEFTKEELEAEIKRLTGK